MKEPRKQRGVALITAVLIVALATILAVNVSFRGYMEQRRVTTAFALDQAFEVAKGAEAWAADTLREDNQGGAREDHLAERWATPIPPLVVGAEGESEMGEVEGQLFDMQGRFNLNTLVRAPDAAAGPVIAGQMITNDAAVNHLARLMELLEIEPKWAGMIADWIDTDINENTPDGGEDSIYTTQTPPYRAANMPITRVSELLSLPGFGVERYRKLEPHVTALPASVRTINVCTATPALLDSMIDAVEWTRAIDQLTEARAQRCEPELNVIKDQIQRAHNDPQEQQYWSELVDTKSQYFEANIWVTIGTTQFTLYSLLYRNDNTVGPLLRSFGSR